VSRSFISDNIPAYNEYDRSYHFSEGIIMPELEYWAWRHDLKEKSEKIVSESNLEHSLKCIESTEIMNDILSGYAPSIAIKRVNARKNKQHFKWLNRSY
jgi:hypothetical protein